MTQENPTWGQARVAAELSVKPGIYVLHVRRAFGLPNRSDEATGGCLRRTGGRSSAIMPSLRRLRFPGCDDRSVPIQRGLVTYDKEDIQLLWSFG